MVERGVCTSECTCLTSADLICEDGKPPLQFSVPVPDYPYFHPKDCSIISDVIGMSNCRSYSIFDPASAAWIFTTLSRKVKSGTTLYLRSRDVTVCPGLGAPEALGSPSKKRALSITESSLPHRLQKRPSTAISDEELAFLYTCEDYN
jgi:hypothetical protein